MSAPPDGSPNEPKNQRVPAPPRTRAKAYARAGLQTLGFLLGITLLGWCISLALRPDNRQQLEQLRDADWRWVAALAALSAASLLANGGAFWLVVRPARRVPFSSVLAVNALATALASLPFKISAICRFVIHRRRDGVPLLTITMWMGSMLAVILATLGPVVAMSLWRGQVDAVWWAGAISGAFVAATVLLLIARAASRDALWTWMAKHAGPAAPVSPAAAGDQANRPRRVRSLLARFAVLPNIRHGLLMLAHPGAVYGASAIRLLDIAIQAARFVVAARLVGQDLAPGDAILAASLYFAVGVASPTGALGFREAAVLGAHAASTDAGGPSGSIIVLTVTAVDTIVVVVAAIAASVFLRLDRFLLRQDPPEQRGEDGPVV